MPNGRGELDAIARAVVHDTARIKLLVTKNPKQERGKSHKRFAVIAIACASPERCKSASLALICFGTSATNSSASIDPAGRRRRRAAADPAAVARPFIYPNRIVHVP
jgi:hypothetical protein